MDFTKSRLEKIASDPKLTGARISAKAFMREVRDVFPKEFGVLYEKINPFERRTKNSLFS